MKGRFFSASHPGFQVPVIPIGPDATESLEMAHMLIEIFKALREQSSVKFLIHDYPQITDRATLVRQKFRWYEWGSEIKTVDWVCEECGQIGDHDCPVPDPLWVLEYRDAERLLFVECVHGVSYCSCDICSGEGR